MVILSYVVKFATTSGLVLRKTPKSKPEPEDVCESLGLRSIA